MSTEAAALSLRARPAALALIDSPERRRETERLMQENVRLAERCSELHSQIEFLERSKMEYQESLRCIDALTKSIKVGIFRFRVSAEKIPKIEYISDRCKRLTGTDNTDGLSALRAFSKNSSPADGMRPCLEAIKAAVMREGPMIWEGKTIVGEMPRFIRIQLNPEPVTERETSYNGSIEDITEERQELERRNKMLTAVDSIAERIAEFRDVAREPAAEKVMPTFSSLSERENQVVDILLLGLSNKEIAARLFISESTVKKHLYKVFEKLGIGSRAELFSLSR